MGIRSSSLKIKIMNFELLKNYYDKWQASRRIGDLENANLYYYALSGLIFDYLDENNMLDGDVKYDNYNRALEVGSWEDLLVELKTFIAFTKPRRD